MFDILLAKLGTLILSTKVLSAIVGAVIIVIMKKVPNEKLESFWSGVGWTIVGPLIATGMVVKQFFNGVNGFGVLKIGQKGWNKVKVFLYNSISISYLAFMKPYREKIKVNLVEYYANKAKEGLDNISNGKVREAMEIERLKKAKEKI